MKYKKHILKERINIHFNLGGFIIRYKTLCGCKVEKYKITSDIHSYNNDMCSKCMDIYSKRKTDNQ